MEWHLPEGYSSRLEPEYHDDQGSEVSEIVHQPEAYEVVRYLLGATHRSTVVDIGCGSGRKLRNLSARKAIGVDCGPNIEFCRDTYPELAEWIEADFTKPDARLVANHVNSDSIVICSDVIEHLADPTVLLQLLNDCYRRGAIVITTTPDRVRVRGSEHLGPPTNQAHVREWELREYGAVLSDAGLPLTYIGYTVNNTEAQELKTILSISDPNVTLYASPRHYLRPLAIIATFNEADVIDEVISDWVGQGCDVHLIDNWSTDTTWEISKRWSVSHPCRVSIERFPEAPCSTYEWIPILNRKADIAAAYPGRWIVHSDADEIRRGPFPGINLADTFDIVANAGANRVDFRVLNFRPIQHDGELCLSGLRSLRFFDFGTRPGHLSQSKAWLQGNARVDLASTGGHEVRFDGAKDFPYKFLLRHYPLRSEAHARRKVEVERLDRRSPFEYGVLNFHAHYDKLAQSCFKIEAEEDLLEWKDETFWLDHGLLIMCDLLKSRVERGRITGGK